MTPDRWQQVSRLFHEALGHDVESRGTFLAEKCAGDEDLRRDVESLLLARDRSPSLSDPQVALAGLASTGTLLDRQLGSYRVTGRLGAGGMGEVYRAYDARLRRDVAIKIVPGSFAADPDRLARFTREARLLAALNHPNIGAIYGVEESVDVRALVLELVEGDTLAERLARSGTRVMSVAETLEIAKQIAGALDAAHEKGIVHRDLKPANIKITPDGVVKVLDFGLGKVVQEGHEFHSVRSETRTETQEGLILGTPAYMSPEQARGLAVDKRSDIWSFGCVLYEMLAGRPAFDGEDVADTLGRVLQRDPDLSLLPDTTPAPVRRLVARCLEKDRNKRLSQIAVAAFQIDEALALMSSGTIDSVVSPPRSSRLPAAALAVGAALGAAVIWFLKPDAPAAPAAVTRLQVSVAPADEIGGPIGGRPTRPAFALSPDGRTLVFSAVESGRRALYIRPLDQPTATLIPDTDEAVGPFFSPDGQWVGFWASGQIRKVPLAGGPSVLVAAVPQLFGSSWGDDQRILFAGSDGGLLEVSAAGGSPTPLTSLNSDRGEFSHRLPHALPGGDAVLFTVTRSRFPRWDEAQIWIHSRRAGTATLLLEGGADARYVSSGHLLYVREGALLAVPFDLARLEVTGGAVGVVPDVMQAGYIAGLPNETGVMQASVSATGTLVYIPGGTQTPTEYEVRQLDRMGKGEPLPIPPHDFRALRISPDGTSMALATVGRDRGIWLYAFARGTFGRLTSAGPSIGPIWTRDGQRIAYGIGTTANTLHWTRADGGAPSELLLKSPLNLLPAAWAPGDRQLLYYSIPAQGGPPTLWLMDLAGGSEPKTLLRPQPLLGGVDLSPDGRWMAYHTQESGQQQVYVEAVPGPGPRVPVSTNGGGSPVWRADGRELFYARPSRDGQQRRAGAFDVAIMAVTVTMDPTLPPAFGQPRQLFAGRYSMNNPDRGFDVSPDGERFVMLQARPRTPDVITGMIVVQNWSEELKRLDRAR
jgi:Tol biopolymer transport system component